MRRSIGGIIYFNYKKLEKLNKVETGIKMNISVVIGNPPYQGNTNSIYQHFINVALKLNPSLICMITRNNWLTSDTLSKTRNALIKFGLISIKNYSKQGDLFKGAVVGVTIFTARKGVKHDAHIEEIVNNKVINNVRRDITGAPAIFMNEHDYTIVDKIMKHNGKSFSREVYPVETFRITSTMHIGRGNTSYIMDFKPERSKEYNVGVLCRGEKQGSAYFNWVRASDVPNRSELINQYKVVACAIHSANTNPVTSIMILTPGQICSSTFAPLYCSKDKVQAYGAYTYIKTKFFRYLVRILCTSGVTHHSEAKFALIPEQDFTKTWTDAELYEKYSLTPEETTHIEQNIKSIK